MGNVWLSSFKQQVRPLSENFELTLTYVYVVSLKKFKYSKDETMAGKKLKKKKSAFLPRSQMYFLLS
jgi:hypothetical protein